MNNELSRVKALVLTGFGLNCERETGAAFKLAGATPTLAHLNDVVADGPPLDEFHILALIGGFSFGDHLGAGTVFANRVKARLKDSLERFVGAGKLVVGICNGFQTMTRLGLVPAFDGKYFEQSVALAENDSGVFRDAWVNLRVAPESPCVFTKGIENIRLPIRHGEGKFVADEAVMRRLASDKQIVMRYANANFNPTSEFPANPNGSLDAVAGVCDPSGRIFGLMPHPEAFLSPYNAPDWTRKKADGAPLPEHGEGAALFINAVQFAAENLL